MMISLLLNLIVATTTPQPVIMGTVVIAMPVTDPDTLNLGKQVTVKSLAQKEFQHVVSSVELFLERLSKLLGNKETPPPYMLDETRAMITEGQTVIQELLASNYGEKERLTGLGKRLTSNSLLVESKLQRLALSKRREELWNTIVAAKGNLVIFLTLFLAFYYIRSVC